MHDDPTPTRAAPDAAGTALPSSDTDDATVRIERTAPDGADAGGAGDLIVQYAVQEKIGGGGMGVVYLARDRKLGRFVAIKRLNRNSQRNGPLRLRFLHEARAVASLNHMHIVHIYALGEDADGPYIVMEYVPGPESAPGVTGGVEAGRPNPPLSLDRRVSRQGQLVVGEAVPLLIKIANAVAFAHANGVIHRDLKPANILLDHSGEPKIVDFGLARRQRDSENRLTTPGEKMLSLGYGAPEQESDAGSADERADVYGLGALLYFTITGQNPRYFREQDIPPPLRDILARALATDREKRWPSAGAFAAALGAFHTRTETTQPTNKTTWRCKWCDTINPLSLRYCSECGWEGSEPCPECGAASFVGIQYCGTCGADARAYEAVSLVLQRMNNSLVRRQYERVLSFAGRTLGFEPAGDAGRAMLRRLQQIREEAEHGLTRREQVKVQIPLEMRMENYERAESLIDEFRSHTEDEKGFESEATKIPAARFHRDIDRARLALRNRKWETALRIAREAIRNDAAAHADGPDLVRRIRRTRRIHRMAVASRSVLMISILYLLAAVPSLKLRLADPVARGRDRFFQPAWRFYDSPPMRGVFQAYGRLWNIGPQALAAFRPAAHPSFPAASDVIETVRVTPAEIQAQMDQLERLRDAYALDLDRIDQMQEQQEATVVLHYADALNTLMEAFRVEGNFEYWAAVHQERERFSAHPVFATPLSDDAPAALIALRAETDERRRSEIRALAHHRVQVTEAYLATLQDWLTQLTKDDVMEAAMAVNHEIRAVRKQPVIAEALRTLENSATNAPIR